MDRRETERLTQAIRGVLANGPTGERAALATVIRVRGSAYRREGTRMLVRANGSWECALSGSCLEPEVAERAQQVIATGEPVIVAYDLTDESLFGLGLGCRGMVDVRIERVEHDALTLAWLDVCERAECAVLVTSLDAARPGRVLVYGEGGHHHEGTKARRASLGGLGAAGVTAMVEERVRELLGVPFPRASVETIAGVELLFEVSSPPPEIVIFGAGHDAVPLAELAWTAGFAVRVIDPREAYLTAQSFPHAERVCVHVGASAGGAGGAARSVVPLSPRSFVVVMNHHLERDQASLKLALSADVAYIGVLGPRARYERLLADLASEGFTPTAEALARVRNPVGLSVGAETPPEVAVSVLAEMLAVQRGFAGGPLTGRGGGIHDPDAARTLAWS